MNNKYDWIFEGDTVESEEIEIKGQLSQVVLPPTFNGITYLKDIDGPERYSAKLSQITVRTRI